MTVLQWAIIRKWREDNSEAFAPVSVTWNPPLLSGQLLLSALCCKWKHGCVPQREGRKEEIAACFFFFLNLSLFSSGYWRYPDIFKKNSHYNVMTSHVWAGEIEMTVRKETEDSWGLSKSETQRNNKQMRIKMERWAVVRWVVWAGERLIGSLCPLFELRHKEVTLPSASQQSISITALDVTGGGSEEEGSGCS